MKPGVYNVKSVQGEDWDLPFVYRAGSPIAPVNNTGWKAQLVIRKSWQGDILIDVDETETDSETTTASIVLGGTNGLFHMFLTEAQTLSIPVGIFVWKFRAGAARRQTMLKGIWENAAP